MLIDGEDPFVTAKPDARLIKLLIRARRFNTTLTTAMAWRLPHWPSARA